LYVVRCACWLQLGLLSFQASIDSFARGYDPLSDGTFFVALMVPFMNDTVVSNTRTARVDR
jgi:hypothetical protein